MTPLPDICWANVVYRKQTIVVGEKAFNIRHPIKRRKCPKCKSKNLQKIAIDREDDMWLYSCTCLDCDEQWKEIHYVFRK